MSSGGEFSDRSDRVCVIGAGSSWLTAARNLREVGLAVDILEAYEDLGGNWDYPLPAARVYRSTHTISSKPGTEFPDYTMPASYLDYPHHTEILAYL
jgi:cation diffusion facilitator CzcD-associated flavoprotein CzcO